MVLAFQDEGREYPKVFMGFLLQALGALFSLSGLGMKAQFQRLSFPDNGKDT